MGFVIADFPTWITRRLSPTPTAALMITSVAIKIDRAKKHMKDLQEKIQSHMVQHPKGVETEEALHR